MREKSFKKVKKIKNMTTRKFFNTNIGFLGEIKRIVDNFYVILSKNQALQMF